MPSKAAAAFQVAIKDAEELLAHFDAINTKPPPANAEVLKRAGLIMALTAWETYVEDRAKEALAARLEVLKGSAVAEFVEKKFAEEIKRLNNPTSDKTRRLFMDYFKTDVTKAWFWASVTPAEACKALDEYLNKRGTAAHRSDAMAGQQGHLVRREDLSKVIKFLQTLVEKTDAAL